MPPSPDTSKALITAFAERGIGYLPGRRLVSAPADLQGRRAPDGSEPFPATSLLAVPKNRAPEVMLIASGLTEDGFGSRSISAHSQTRLPSVYAIGDLASTGTPKAGVFAEGGAKTVAANLIATLRQQSPTARNPGAGSCYIEFGAGRIARVDVDFFSGPAPTGTFQAPSVASYESSRTSEKDAPCPLVRERRPRRRDRETSMTGNPGIAFPFAQRSLRRMNAVRTARTRRLERLGCRDTSSGFFASGASALMSLRSSG